MVKKINVITFFVALIISGCATKFSGDAKINGGPAGCENICANWNMELVGMVALGEYTDGCICKKKGVNLSMDEAAQALIISSNGSGGVIGKIMKTQEGSSNEIRL